MGSTVQKPGRNAIALLDRRAVLLGTGALLLGRMAHSQVPPEARASGKTYAFDNARWFDGGAFRDGKLYSVDGTLTFERPDKIDETIDLNRKYVTPPFAEAHNHNVEPRPQLSELIRKYLSDGIFYVKNPNNPPRTKTALLGKVNTRDSVDVAFANGGLTATGGHPIALANRNLERSGRAEDWAEGAFYFTIDTLEDLERKWPRVLASNPDFVKAYLQYSEEHDRRKNNDAYVERSALDPKLLPHIVRRAHESGLRVSCHIETAADFHNALVAGVDEINHMPGLKPERNDWKNVEIERYRISKADADLAARNGTVIVTTFASAINRIAQANAGEAFREWRELLVWNLSILKDADVALAIGSDRYTDTAAAEALGLHGLGVFDNRQLLKMWCETSAKTIFPMRKIGHLREGYEASFLVLDADPLEHFDSVRKISRRFKQGEFIHI
jgi:imidazolonepropionase-like amidohydrolase